MNAPTLTKILFLCAGLSLVAPCLSAATVKGQVIIDPEHPQYFKREGGKHLFLCGADDPEDFLYRGKRNQDGTRTGDQVQLIQKLVEHGGNFLCAQIVRTHGGDAKEDRSQNPFLNSDPAKGLDERILKQWETWFAQLEENNIVLYLYFYDDGSLIWDTGDSVGREERLFVETIVTRFKHLRNLVWVIGEESEERYSTARVQALAAIVRQADDRGHIIGNHHLSGTTFKAWKNGGAIQHFLMQLRETGDPAHQGAIEALNNAAGRYPVMYAESTGMPSTLEGMRTHIWAAATAGLMPLLRTNIADVAPEFLQQCRHLQTFFEMSDFYTMSPHDELKHAQTQYVLANPGRSYIAYSGKAVDGKIGLKNLPIGRCDIVWMDPRTGYIERQSHEVIKSGDAILNGPAQFRPEVAAWIRFAEGTKPSTTAKPATPVATGEYFPPPEAKGGWRTLTSEDEVRTVGGMDPKLLAQLEAWLLQSDTRDFAATIIRHGYVVLEVERGNSARTDSRRVASVSKAICATVLAIASEQSQQGNLPKKMKFDDPAFDFIPWAQPLSDPRKAKITVRQLLNHTSGICPESTGAPNDGTWEYELGLSGDARTALLAFDPGTACGYSTHAFNHASLVCETVTGKPYDEFVIEALFTPLGIRKWWFQYYDSEKIGRHPSHSMGLPSRELARIAYCMLHGGKWRNQQVIPKWFVDETAAPTHNVKTPELRFQRAAESFSHGWELPARLNGAGGRSGEGIPADARAKPGSGGQYMAFVPSLDLVITRQTGSSGQWDYEEYLRRACAAVIRDSK